MNRWDRMQSEISEWATRNFRDNPAWHPMLGLVEEVAEYYAALNGMDINTDGGAIVKRGDLRVQMADAIGDQAVYALNLCERVGLKFGSDVAATEEGCGQHLIGEEMVGVLGMACRAVLKHAQGIRKVDDEQRAARIRIAISLWYRWAQWQAMQHGLPSVFDITEAVWDSVRRRNWVDNPGNANEVAS